VDLTSFHTALAPFLEEAAALLPAGAEVIDAHTHLGLDEDGRSLYPDGLIQQLDDAGARRACVFPLHDPERHPNYSVPNDRVLAWAADSGGRFVPFCRLDPAEDPIAEGERCFAAGARGIKLHPRAQKFDFDGGVLTALDGIFGLAEREQVPILIHAGRGLPPIADGLADIALRHPGAVLILAHAAIADQAILTERLAEHPGVLYDLSTWATFDQLELFARVPAERIVFATDPPYGHTPSGLYAVLRLLDYIGLDDAAARLVLGGTMASLIDGHGLPTITPPRVGPTWPVHARMMRIYGFLLTAGPALFLGNPEIARMSIDLAAAACRDRDAGPLAGPLERLGTALQAALSLLDQGEDGLRPTLELVQRCAAYAATQPA
jgi:predicted TIM-barrel fold metal-dependent hydrolase